MKRARRGRSLYYSHSDYSSGLKVKPLWQLFEDNPTEPLRRALFGMMPKNKLRYQRILGRRRGDVTDGHDGARNCQK